MWEVRLASGQSTKLKVSITSPLSGASRRATAHDALVQMSDTFAVHVVGKDAAQPERFQMAHQRHHSTAHRLGERVYPAQKRKQRWDCRGRRRVEIARSRNACPCCARCRSVSAAGRAAVLDLDPIAGIARIAGKVVLGVAGPIPAFPAFPAIPAMPCDNSFGFTSHRRAGRPGPHGA